jgi:hypothetical protein
MSRIFFFMLLVLITLEVAFVLYEILRILNIPLLRQIKPKKFTRCDGA